MTRGYVTIVNGNKVIKIAYLSSDAYLSWYGKKILEAVMNGSIESFIDLTRKDNIAAYGNDDDPCKGFALNWIKPDKESRAYGKEWNYAEYGYIYNGKTGILKVYNDGELLLTVKPEEQEKYLYIFEKENEIYNALSYDAEKMDNVLFFVDTMKAAARLSLDELKEIAKKAEEERYYLSDTHCIAAGHYEGHETYQKEFSSSDSSKAPLCFIVQNEWNRDWQVLLQTPFARLCVCANRKTRYGGYSSEKAAVKAIKERIKTVGPEKMLRLAEIFNEFTKVRSSVSESAVFAAKLEEEWAKNPWWVPSEHLSVKGLENELRRYA